MENETTAVTVQTKSPPKVPLIISASLIVGIILGFIGGNMCPVNLAGNAKATTVEPTSTTTQDTSYQNPFSSPDSSTNPFGNSQ